MENIVKIISIGYLTHDVLQIVVGKPDGFFYIPGQAVDLSINKIGWQKEFRPFTLTSLPGDNYLQFTIKTYPSHGGVTNELLSLKAGDELLLGEVFGDIHYKGTGIFLAGGAGITPFIAILKDLENKGQLTGNKLIFANKQKRDIILEDTLKGLLGNNLINVLSEENLEGYEHGFITAEIIKLQMAPEVKHFYLCGPEPMMKAIKKELSKLGIQESAIVKEDFA